MNLYPYCFTYDEYNPNQPRDGYGRWTKEGFALPAEVQNVIKRFPETLRRAVTFALTGEPVASITGKEFQKDGIPLTTKVSQYYKDFYNNQVKNEVLGIIALDFRGVKDDIGHGLSALKAAAFMCVPQVIEKGFIFDRQENWKGRGYDTFVLVAPVLINNQRYVEEVIVKKRPAGRQGLYLHEVELTAKLEEVFKTASEGAPLPTSKLIIAKKIEDYKPIRYGQDKYTCRLEIRTLLREVLSEDRK